MKGCIYEIEIVNTGTGILPENISQVWIWSMSDEFWQFVLFGLRKNEKYQVSALQLHVLEMAINC